MTPIPVTVLIAARNEAVNLPKCLATVAGVAARVVVVDSHSTDTTAAVAAAGGAEVVPFTHSGGYPKKRQWALDTLDIHTEWVLLLDADEEVPLSLWAEIAAAVADPGSPNGFLVTKGFHFLGKRFRFGGFSFAAVVLIRRMKARFERLIDDPAGGLDMEVHERVIVDGPVGRMRTPLIHDDFKGLEAYLDRHNRYSTWEARLRLRFLTTGEYGESAVRPRLFGNAQERRRFLKHVAVRVPGESALWFGYHFVVRLGFLEGRRGLIASRLRADYIADVRAKVYEFRERTRQGKDVKMTRRSRFLRTVRWVLVVAIIFELVLAVGLGLGRPPLVQSDPDIGYVFRADQTLRRFGNRVVINSFHQRSGPVEPRPAAGTVRVLCVGDSVTWGGVQADQSETYPEVLAECLRAGEPGRPVEVLNASAGSWGIGNELAYLRKFGTFGSRWVVWQIGSHDLLQSTSPGDDVGRSAFHPDRNPPCATAELIDRYLWPRGRSWFVPLPSDGGIGVQASDAFPGNMRDLRRFISIARAAGSQVVVVHTPDRDEVSPRSGPWPTTYDAARGELLDICRGEGVPVVDLVRLWRAGPRDAGEYFRDAVHPNPTGNAAIAAAVVPYLK